MSKAFIFPGQGSQSVGMLSELCDEFPIVFDTFNEASDALGYDLWSLVQYGPEDMLNSTDKTQPAMLAAGVAVWRVWNEKGSEKPSIMAGHSLGEYTALVCADALSFAEGVKLVADRGHFMQEAVIGELGAMAAILGLEDDKVVEICESAAQAQVVEAVNFNSPGQVVIAGDKAAVDRAIQAANEAGAKKSVLLPVSVPSHCSLMKPAAQQLMERLADVNISAPSIPVIHNVNADIAESAGQIKELLVKQLYLPVQWVACVNKILATEVSGVIECGPGKVLAGLNKRIARRTPALPVFDSASLAKALEN